MEAWPRVSCQKRKKVVSSRRPGPVNLLKTRLETWHQKQNQMPGPWHSRSPSRCSSYYPDIFPNPRPYPCCFILPASLLALALTSTPCLHLAAGLVLSCHVSACLEHKDPSSTVLGNCRKEIQGEERQSHPTTPQTLAKISERRGSSRCPSPSQT